MVRRKGYADTLEVRVELIDGSLLEKYAELEALQKNIHDRIKAILGIEIAVSLVEPKSIERFTGKAQRVVDLRGRNNLTHIIRGDKASALSLLSS